MANKHQVIDLHQRYPEWTARQIADELGCLPEYVNKTAYRNGLILPRVRATATPEDLRKRAADMIRRAEAMEHLHNIINCGNCSGSRQSGSPHPARPERREGMREQLTDEALVLMASGSKPGSVGLDYDEALTSLARELLARRRATPADQPAALAEKETGQ